MLKLIFYIAVILITEVISYKYIRKIDILERKKLQLWEIDFLEKLNHKKKDNNVNKSDNNDNINNN